MDSAESRSQLERLRRVWLALGAKDPLWAVLSHADKRGGRWNADEFFATGRLEIDSQLAALAARGWPRQRGVALDFGCGAGRLSRALAAHFTRVIGVDVSASMIAAARTLNADVENLGFVENAAPRLTGIADASVDLVFSHITLQHIPAALAAGYVEEFFRVLAPGGVAVFQFVAAADQSLRGRVFSIASNRWLKPLRQLVWRRRDVFEMHALAEHGLHERLARQRSLRLLSAFDDAGAGAGWRGRRWVVVNDDVPALTVRCSGAILYADADDTQIGAPLLAGREHEPHVAAAIEDCTQAGDVVVDIGANIGAFALPLAARVGSQGRVIAVEPLPGNCAAIARAALLGGFANIEIIAAAASDRAEAVTLRTHPTTSNAATPAAAGERLREARGADIKVAGVVLDDALASLDRLDLVKLDIVGMEPRALRGMARLRARFAPVVVCEFHPWAIERASGEAPEALLADLFADEAQVSVLHRDGSREIAAYAAAVLDSWQRSNADAASAGRIHLDLLSVPASRLPRFSASARR